MKRKRRQDSEPLRDGERLRVPMFAMDGMDPIQCAVARYSARVTDADGNSGLALRRPGFRFVLDDVAGAHAKEVAYRRADAEMVKAWRAPPGFGGKPGITGAGERGPIGEREGDLCTINGRAGHLKMVAGELRCVLDATDARRRSRRAEEEEENGLERVERQTSDQRRRVARYPEDFDEDEDEDGDGYETSAEEITRHVATHTESARRSDHRTMDQMMRDHQIKMDRLYDQLDSELSEKWRRS